MKRQLFLIPVIFVILMVLTAMLSAQEDWGGRTVEQITVRMQHIADNQLVVKLSPLLKIKEGDIYQYRLIRQSMENLYLTGVLQNVSVEVKSGNPRKVRLAFICEAKRTIRRVHVHKRDLLPMGDVRAALLSLRRNSFFDQRLLDEARQQLKRLYEGEGYLNPGIDLSVSADKKRQTCDIHVRIQSGSRSKIGRLELVCQNVSLKKRLQGSLKLHYYQPRLLEEQVERMRQQLRKLFFFFPEIEITPQFNGLDRTIVDIKIDVDPGPLYRFKFVGMPDRYKLIQSVWTTRVFERWAESESRSRLLLYLKNKGYQNALVESNVDDSHPGEKRITFTAQAGKRYRLGKIQLSGAPEISTQEVQDLLSVDDSWFSRILWLLANPILVDQEMIRLYYYYKGYPDAKVSVETTFKGGKADLFFKVAPGDRVLIKSVTWRGNDHVETQVLQDLVESRTGDVFVEHRFSEDLERLRQFYISRGYALVKIEPRISPGLEKEIEIHIVEGNAYRLGKLIIIGASSMQEKWLLQMFPLKPDGLYDISKVGRFLNEIEQLGSFSSVQLNTVEIEPGYYNALLTITPDSSRFYGFGLGWENGKGFQGLRGTVEFQGRNIFSSYSSLSGIIQAGLKETRLVVSLDTPNLFGTQLNSSFKLWNENESYTSYKFKRIGVGPTLLKRTGSTSYISASLNWYRTKITELLITPGLVDNGTPFDTLAFNFSFVTDKRDDPFNPTNGDFFSTDLKVGMPFFRQHDSFFRFMWRYQKNLKMAKNLSLALSLRNGFAAGDMSITERFFAGGLNSFRGTRLDKLGPKDLLTGLPMGGNGLLLFNAEATFPLIILPTKDWYGSVFIDIGNVYSRAGHINLSKVERALGFGIKYRTPLGPVRIDFSWNLRARADYDFIFHFGIGNAF